MQLQVWAMQMLHPISKCKRFIRKLSMKQEIARLRAQDHILYSGNVHLPEIALTFDDGPDPYYTPQILDILQQYGVKATFFCIGRQVAAYPRLVRRAYEAGHVIGNHSWDHPDIGILSTADICKQLNRTSDAIQAVIGERSTFFRPPYGSLSRQVLIQTSRLGLITIMWNDKAEDWARPGIDFIIRHALDAANGTVILLHDGDEDRSQTVAALPAIIAGLQERGFQFVTVQQMVDHLHQAPLPHKRLEGIS